MNWNKFLKEGDEAVAKVYRGLLKRGINAGQSILTQFNTDEDIPVYDSSGKKIFWISVKSVGNKIVDPKNPPGNFQGYLCGEVESKQWVNPPSVIIWLCNSTNVCTSTKAYNQNPVYKIAKFIIEKRRKTTS